MITLAERYHPELTMVEPMEGVASTARPSVTDPARPPKVIPRPPAQDSAPKEFEGSGRREKKMPLSSCLGRNGTTTAGPAKPENPKRDEEPEWLKVDGLTDDQLAEWRREATKNGPMKRIALKIVERWEMKNTTAGGSPAKDPHRPSLESSCVDGKFYQKPATESSNADEIEHKTH